MAAFRSVRYHSKAQALIDIGCKDSAFQRSGHHGRCQEEALEEGLVHAKSGTDLFPRPGEVRR